MKIEFKTLDKNLNVSDYAIREVTESFHGAESPSKYTHFQALISGKGISRSSTINYLFKYYGENNQFLGLDEGNAWIRDRVPFALSAHITIPDNTAKTEVQLHAKKDYMQYIGWL